MRHISTKRSSNTSSLKNNSNNKSIIITNEDKICKAKTKKGEKCSNKVMSGSNYCGIKSHQIKEAKETIKDTIKETIKETIKDQLKETIKDQIKDQIKEILKATPQ